MFTPFKLRGMTWPTGSWCRRCVPTRPPTACRRDFHFQHYTCARPGRRGAGDDRNDLRVAGCAHHPGLRRHLERRAGSRLEAHRRFRACQQPGQDGLQIGHAGRKGSTRLAWDGIDQPLEQGNWPLLAPSPLPYIAGVSQVPRK
jgi:anthraniloyl-CoA monooxygenase